MGPARVVPRVKGIRSNEVCGFYSSASDQGRSWPRRTRKARSRNWWPDWSNQRTFPTDEQESIVKAIMKREELGSTGIGRGVAVPHTKHPSVDRLIGTVGVSGEGR